MAIWVIVPAAGIGTRMSSSIPKQYLQIDGESVLTHTLKAISRVCTIQAIMLAVSSDDDYASAQGLVNGVDIDGCKLLTCIGGQTRAQSVSNALAALSPYAAAGDWVLVHDAARPCVRAREIKHLISTLEHDAVGGLLAVPVRGTLKKSDGHSLVVETVDRSQMWEAATPQMFPYGLLTEAIASGLAKGLALTDEASAIEALGHAPKLVPCSADNIKITYPQDLQLASLILQSHRQDDQEDSHV